MSARTSAERDRSRAFVCDVIAAVAVLCTLVGVILGYVRDGAPDPLWLAVLAGALALRAHAEVYRMRAVLERIAERAGSAGS